MFATMKKPLCRLCGERHYAHEPHIFGDEPDRARSSVGEHRTVAPKVAGSSPVVLAKPERVDVVPDAHEVIDTGSAEGDQVRVELPVSDGVAPSSKSDRLAVAKEALTGAERSQRYREAHREEYNARAKARMKARRAKIRGSPSE